MPSGERRFRSGQHLDDEKPTTLLRQPPFALVPAEAAYLRSIHAWVDRWKTPFFKNSRCRNRNLPHSRLTW